MNAGKEKCRGECTCRREEGLRSNRKSKEETRFMHLSDTCFVSWPDLQSKKGQKVEEKKRFERQQMKVSAGNKNRIFF